MRSNCLGGSLVWYGDGIAIMSNMGEGVGVEAEIGRIPARRMLTSYHINFSIPLAQNSNIRKLYFSLSAYSKLLDICYREEFRPILPPYFRRNFS